MPFSSLNRYLPILTASSAAGILSLAPSVALANTPYTLSYKLIFDPTGSAIPVAFTMLLDGRLQADGNTVVVNSITSLDFDSSVTGSVNFVPDLGILSFLYSLDDFVAGVSTPGPATTVLDGDAALQDFLACETIDCSSGQIFAIGEVFGSDTSDVFYSDNPLTVFVEPYDRQNFRLTPQAQQVPAPLPVFGAAVAFGASRRLRSRLKAAQRH